MLGRFSPDHRKQTRQRAVYAAGPDAELRPGVVESSLSLRVNQSQQHFRVGRLNDMVVNLRLVRKSGNVTTNSLPCPRPPLFTSTVPP